MSLISEKVIRAGRAREERARAETESYNEARYQLSHMAFGSRSISRILESARHNGRHTCSIPDLPDTLIDVKYSAGEYTVS